MAKTYIPVIKDRSSLPIFLTQFKDEASGVRRGPGRFQRSPSTIGIATIAATLKMWARYRKLCTLVHKDTQALIRALEHPMPWSLDHQQTVLAAWDEVERDLMTRTDTGYAFGTRFVSKAVTAALAYDVEKAAKGLSGHTQAREDALTGLKIVQSMYIQRIDAVA